MTGGCSTSGRNLNAVYARHTSGLTLGGMLIEGSGFACFFPMLITRLVSKMVSPASPKNMRPPNVDDILFSPPLAPRNAMRNQKHKSGCKNKENEKEKDNKVQKL
eukprot:Hpha_TRINITY_DN9994_c0_g1::TRINITY_DN9994_c0_g1_i1::g.140584::m.140584